MIPVPTGPYGDRSLMGAAAAAQWVKSLSVIERERERESLDLGPGGRHVGNVMNRFLKKTPPNHNQGRRQVELPC